MTNKDAIKYLKQLYPYGGHCWLDEQRTEAIGMAIQALQEEPKQKFKIGDIIKFKGIHDEDVTRVITNIQKGDGDGFRYFFADGSIYSIGDDGIELVEEPVSEDFEEASKEWLRPKLDKSYANYGEGKMMELTRFDGYAMLDAIEFGAKWKEEQMKKKAINATIETELDSHCADYGIQKIKCAFGELEAKKLKNGAKVKLVIFKED